MSDLFRLTDKQMQRIEPYSPLSHGVPRVDDRRIVSGIIFVICNGLRWRDAPAAYGPPKTIYNRFIRRSRMGVFNRIFAGLAAEGGPPDQLMIDATHLNAHRTAARLLKKGLFPDVSAYGRSPVLTVCRLPPSPARCSGLDTANPKLSGTLAGRCSAGERAEGAACAPASCQQAKASEPLFFLQSSCTG